MKTPREKYQNDPNYHTCVSHMVQMIERAHFTPSEMREMAVLACTIYEHRVKPIYIPDGSKLIK